MNLVGIIDASFVTHSNASFLVGIQMATAIVAP